MYPISIGLVIENKAVGEELSRALQEISVRVLFEVPEIPQDWAAFQDRIERVQPDVVLLDVTHPRLTLDDIIGRIRGTAAHPEVFAVHTDPDPVAILAAMRAGACEFLHPPFAQPLQAALERLSQARQRVREKKKEGGKTLGFVSAKGGCGATTIACHTAVELANKAGGKVLLADLDFQAGMISFLAKAKSQYSIADAVNNIQRLDPSYWRALVSNGIPNLEIVSAPVTPAAKEVSVGAVKQVVAFARNQYDWSVLDLGRNLNATTLSILDLIDETYLVTSHEIPALHQAKQMIGFLLNSGYSRDSLRLILNRPPRRMEVTLDELGEMLGLPIFATVENDYQAMQDAYSEGRLLEGSGNIRRSVAALTDKIAGTKSTPKKRFSIFG